MLCLICTQSEQAVIVAPFSIFHGMTIFMTGKVDNSFNDKIPLTFQCQWQREKEKNKY